MVVAGLVFVAALLCAGKQSRADWLCGPERAFGCIITLQACQHSPQAGERRSTQTVSGSTEFSVAGSSFALKPLGTNRAPFTLAPWARK